MYNLAESIDSVCEEVSYLDYDTDCEVITLRAAERESLSENFMHELEAWARHSLAMNGFADF